MDEVREAALRAALQLKPHDYVNAMGGMSRNVSVSSVLADAKQIEEYLRGTKPNGTKKKK